MMRLAVPAMSVAMLAIACGQPEGGDTAEGAAEPSGTPVSKTSQDGPIKATVTVTPDNPVFGDPIKMTLTVEAEPGVDVEMPPFTGSVGRFTSLDFKPDSQRRDDGGTINVQTYRLDAQMSGRERIPALRIEWIDGRGNAATSTAAAAATPTDDDSGVRELLTEEIPLTIASAVAEGELTGELRPAREKLPAFADGSFIATYWPHMAIALALLCVGLAVVLLTRRRVVRVQISAYDRAVARLHALEARGFPSAEDVDAWYVELSAIVRHYLEDRFALRAPELTTEEFLHEARRSAQLTDGHRALLSSFLEDCDRVKFAAYQPGKAESAQALVVSRQFVEETRWVDTAGSPTPPVQEAA